MAKAQEETRLSARPKGTAACGGFNSVKGGLLMQTILNICSPSALDPYDSFGLLATETARHLSRKGVYTNLFSLGQRDIAAQDDEVRAIVNQPIKPAYGGLKMGYPTTFPQQPVITQYGKQVGIVMFESTVPPKPWDVHMNHCDAIITPCQFCRDIFIAAGVTVPIHVVGLGINPLYQPPPTPRPTDRPFTYLAFIDRGLRKGGIQALQAFQEAFGDDTNYRLILKGRKSKINATILNPNVELIQEDYTEQQMLELFWRADVMVGNTSGEGFGWLPRQAAATGMIALATNFAGTADDIEHWGVPLDYKLVKADWSNHGRLSKMDLGEWAQVLNLPDALGDIADNRDFYQRQAARLAPNVHRLYSWESFAEKVLNIWEDC